MSDTIETRIVIDNKTEEEYSYSVKEYATELLSKSNEYPEETIKLVKALLNYGTAAQNFFKYNTDKPANAGLSDTDKAVAAADFEEYKAVIKTDSANSQSNGLTYYGTKLNSCGGFFCAYLLTMLITEDKTAFLTYVTK